MTVLAAYAVPHPPLIIPAVGRGEERAIQATIDAYTQVAREVAALAPDTVVVSSPHAPLYRDAFHVAGDTSFVGSMARFGAPQERVSAAGDARLAQAVVQAAQAAGIACEPFVGHTQLLDHATFIPLWFLARECPLPPIVVVGLSGLGPRAHGHLGRIVAREANSLGRRIVWLASGDLSHKLKADGPYGFAEEGPLFDQQICEIFASGQLERLGGFTDQFAEAAAECGLRSFQLMAGALKGLPIDSELLSHEGTFGVGYGVAAFRVRGEGGA